MVQFSDETGNFCCSKTGLLIAESGKNNQWNLQLGPCILDTGYSIDVLKNIQVDCL